MSEHDTIEVPDLSIDDGLEQHDGTGDECRCEIDRLRTISRTFDLAPTAGGTCHRAPAGHTGVVSAGSRGPSAGDRCAVRRSPRHRSIGFCVSDNDQTRADR